MSDECLPESLKGKRHDDWRWYVRWVPRAWTARCGPRWPQPPKRIWGSAGWTEEDHHMFGHHEKDYYMKIKEVLPIPKAGHALLSVVLWSKFLPLPMFAITYRNGDYFSIGVVRWDDVDKYYDLHRWRGHGVKGYITMGAFVLSSSAVIYFWVWPWILEKILRLFS